MIDGPHSWSREPGARIAVGPGDGNSSAVRRSNKPIGERLDRPVALASAFPQALQIEHADVSPLVFYETGLLQGIGHDRHARPSHPQHLGDKFLGERKILAADQVPATQEPAREARFDRMDRVTGSRLLRLRQKDLLMPYERGAKCQAPLGEGTDVIHVEDRRGARDLYDGPADRDAAVEGG